MSLFLDGWWRTIAGQPVDGLRRLLNRNPIEGLLTGHQQTGLDPGWAPILTRLSRYLRHFHWPSGTSSLTKGWLIACESGRPHALDRFCLGWAQLHDESTFCRFSNHLQQLGLAQQHPESAYRTRQCVRSVSVQWAAGCSLLLDMVVADKSYASKDNRASLCES